MCVAPGLVLGGKMSTQVAEPTGAEDRVDHRVREDVGVGVPGEAALVRDLDAPEDERAAHREAVAVVADSDPESHGAYYPSGSIVRARRSKVAISSMPQSRIASTARS